MARRSMGSRFAILLRARQNGLHQSVGELSAWRSPAFDNLVAGRAAIVASDCPDDYQIKCPPGMCE